MTAKILCCTQCKFAYTFELNIVRTIIIKLYTNDKSVNCSISSVQSSEQKPCSTSDKTERNNSEIPEAPTTCCMSGCANCVWIDYAEKLTAHFKDGGEKAREEIMEKVTDPNVRAFLLMELRTMDTKK